MVLVHSYDVVMRLSLSFCLALTQHFEKYWATTIQYSPSFSETGHISG